jgi:polysaccharide deacetylase 2 family uncharacterized protein YibQ
MDMITVVVMKRGRKKKSFFKGNKKAITVFLLCAIAGLLFIILLILPRTINSGTSADKSKGNAGSETGEKMSDAEKRRAEEERTEKTVGTTLLVKKHGRVAFIIDDAGNDLVSLKPFLSFPGKITISVLPQLPYSHEASRQASESGKEVILHLPMQPLGNENPGPGAIEVSMSRDQIWSLLDKDFSSVPNAKGANNHMGSLATQDKKVMDTLFAYLKEKKKFFVDSKTIGTTLSEQYAHQYEIPLLERQFFLDTSTDKESVIRALNQGIAFSRTNGYAVIIGHVQNSVVSEVLAQEYEQLVASGIEFMTVAELLDSLGRAGP